jgi:hypothetical protein
MSNPGTVRKQPFIVIAIPKNGRKPAGFVWLWLLSNNRSIINAERDPQEQGL